MAMRVSTPNRSRPVSPVPQQQQRQVPGANASGTEPAPQQTVYVYLRVRHGADSTPVVSVRNIGAADNGGKNHPPVSCEVAAPYRGRFSFPFDGCVAPGASTAEEEQRALFDLTGRSLVEHAFRGFNAALVAYGQTGSGKTHSVFGPRRSFGSEMEGLVPRVCRAIFGRAEMLSAVQGIQTFVTASLLEVYLDDVFDLLQDRKQLRVRQNSSAESSSSGVTFSVTGARSVEVKSYSDVASVLRDAEPLRTVAATAVHDRSSRAHTLFELRVTTVALDGVQLSSKLVIADLAGSERVREAKTETGVAFEQACSINKSLLALGSCVEAAVHNRTGEFRTSTLTKLLKEFIGGNAITSVLVTISPEAKDVNATLQTLRFSERLKFVRCAPKENRTNVEPVVPESSEAQDGKLLKVSAANESFLHRKEMLEAEMTLEIAIEQLRAARVGIVESDTDDEVGKTNDFLRDVDRELEELDRQLSSLRSQMPLGKQLATALNDLHAAKCHSESLESQIDDLKRENGQLRTDLSAALCNVNESRKREMYLASFEDKYAQSCNFIQSMMVQWQRRMEVLSDDVVTLSEVKSEALSCSYHKTIDALCDEVLTLRDNADDLRRQMSQLQRRTILLEADRRVQSENSKRERERAAEQHRAELEMVVSQYEESASAAQRYFAEVLAQKTAETDSVLRHCATAQRALNAAISAAGSSNALASPHELLLPSFPRPLQARSANINCGGGGGSEPLFKSHAGDASSFGQSEGSPSPSFQQSPTNLHC